LRLRSRARKTKRWRTDEVASVLFGSVCFQVASG
jgi:hypothetical protein